MVELLVAVGANGIGLMVTLVVPIGQDNHQQLQIQNTCGANVVDPTILGFCKVDVNAFGPVQLYVAPATRFENKFKVWPDKWWSYWLLLC